MEAATILVRPSYRADDGTAGHWFAKRFPDFARAFAVSTARSRGGLPVFREVRSRRAASATSSTACWKAASFAFDGSVNPLSFRTNCTADARISSSVAGGAKLKRVRMFLHIEWFSVLVAACE
jgi:hypothetical protein